MAAQTARRPAMGNPAASVHTCHCDQEGAGPPHTVFETDSRDLRAIGAIAGPASGKDGLGT